MSSAPRHSRDVKRLLFILFGTAAGLLILTSLIYHRGTTSASWLWKDSVSVVVRGLSEDAAARVASSLNQNLVLSPGQHHQSNQSVNGSKQLYSIPHLLIVGVQKCGTSALYYSLCAHPFVSCAAYKKEPFYLSDNAVAQRFSKYFSIMTSERESFHRDYVQACFNVSEVGPQQITLEASTTYFASATAFQAITTGLVNSHEVKVIVSVREPVSRAYSNFQHHVRRGMHRREDGTVASFAEVVQPELQILRYCRTRDEMVVTAEIHLEEQYHYQRFYDCVQEAVDGWAKQHAGSPIRGYVLQGMYYQHLQRWLEWMPSRVHVVFHEELRTNPVDVLTEVQSFLGLPHFDYGQLLHHIMHEYQEGSRYDKLSDPIVKELAEEFDVHNRLLEHLLDRPISWADQLRRHHYTVPIGQTFPP